MAYGIPKPPLPTRRTSIGPWQEPSTLSSTIWELEASDASGRFGHQRQKSYLPPTAPSPIAAARQHAAAAAAPRRTGRAFGRERDYRARSPVRSDGSDSHFDGGHPKCTSATARAPISAELPYVPAPRLPQSQTAAIASVGAALIATGLSDTSSDAIVILSGEIHGTSRCGTTPRRTRTLSPVEMPTPGWPPNAKSSAITRGAQDLRASGLLLNGDWSAHAQQTHSATVGPQDQARRNQKSTPRHGRVRPTSRS